MSTQHIQLIQGMSDLDAPDIFWWQKVEADAREVFALYGYEEVRTPVVEYTSVFERSLGDTTDVVQKEMYTFQDRGGRNLSLRPEGTAGVMRYLADKGPEAANARVYYIGPMFRCERPQAGRKRQFHQLGVEALGPANPPADAEMLALQAHLLERWGLEKFTLHLNTRGTPEDRQAVVKGLTAALVPHRAALCEDCRRRFDTNILRILDCKNEACGKIVDGIPPVTEFMCDESRRYLDCVRRYLDLLNIPVQMNPRLVRGLDYYVHTVWEIACDALGAQNAIAGGGRYRMDMDGRLLEGVGFAFGLERVIAALQQACPQGPVRNAPPLVGLISLGEKALEENLILAQTLRRRNVRCAMDLGKGSLKSQMRAANKAGAQQVIIRGDQELEKGVFVLKRMDDGSQRELDLPALMEILVPGVAPDSDKG